MRHRSRLELRETANAAGGRRILVEPSASLSADYRVAVEPTALRLEGTLDRGVLAGRVVGGAPRPFHREYREWREALEGCLRHRGVVVRSDVRDCFASIMAGPVVSAVAEVGVDPSVIEAVLGAFHAEGVRGLPVGPAPSLVLANAVLQRADREAREAGATVLRWVDDVVLVCADRPTAARALDAWVRGLRAVGLRPHDGKTEILPADEARYSLLGRASFDRAPERGMLRPP